MERRRKRGWDSGSGGVLSNGGWELAVASLDGRGYVSDDGGAEALESSVNLN